MESMINSLSRRGKVTLRLAIGAVIVATFFAVPRITASAHPTLASPPFTIGVSNNLIGNGWRDEMVCSIRAEVHHSGLGHTVVQQNQLDTNLQISQIRNMISQGVNAIVIDPNSATALNGAIEQAVSRGITIVIVDQVIPALLNKPGIYQAANNQRAYGRLGMQWLVKQLGGHGNIALLEGIAGAPANTDRELGQQDVLKHYPKIHVVSKVYTGWDYTKGGQEMTALLNSGKRIDGVWTSGIDYTVVNAYRTAHRPLVPIVGADNNGFVHQLLTIRTLVGAAVTNPPPIGGVGAAIALNVLQGKHEPALTTLKPQVWANTNKFGLKQLRSHYLPSRAPSYAADWIVRPYSNYTQSELFTCNSSW
jgi:ribose transport system substrate-binding protein